MRLTAPASLADHALCRRRVEDSDAQGHRECESDIAASLSAKGIIPIGFLCSKVRDLATRFAGARSTWTDTKGAEKNVLWRASNRDRFPGAGLMMRSGPRSRRSI
jgi:hypothetical protein